LRFLDHLVSLLIADGVNRVAIGVDYKNPASHDGTFRMIAEVGDLPIQSLRQSHVIRIHDGKEFACRLV
jgi:hypothetical protein